MAARPPPNPQCTPGPRYLMPSGNGFVRLCDLAQAAAAAGRIPGVGAENRRANYLASARAAGSGSNGNSAMPIGGPSGAVDGANGSGVIPNCGPAAAASSSNGNCGMPSNSPARQENGPNVNAGMPNDGPARQESGSNVNPGIPNDGPARHENDPNGSADIPINDPARQEDGPNGDAGMPNNGPARLEDGPNGDAGMPNNGPVRLGNGPDGNSGMPNNGHVRLENGPNGNAGMPNCGPASARAASSSSGNSGPNVPARLENGPYGNDWMRNGPARLENCLNANDGMPINGPARLQNDPNENYGIPNYGPARRESGRNGNYGIPNYGPARRGNGPNGNFGMPNYGPPVGAGNVLNLSGIRRRPYYGPSRGGIHSNPRMPNYGPVRTRNGSLETLPNVDHSTILCPMCCRRFPPPMIICATGHVSCALCFCHCCGGCRVCCEPFVATRHLVMEDQLATVPLNCCQLHSHMRSQFPDLSNACADVCEFRPIQCNFRLPTEPGECGETVPFTRYWEHLRTKHNCCVHPALINGNVLVNPDPFRICDFRPDGRTIQYVLNIVLHGRPQEYFAQGNWNYPATIVSFRQLFIVNSAIEGTNFRFWVTTLQSENEASKYSAVFRIEDAGPYLAGNRARMDAWYAACGLEPRLKVHNVHVARDIMTGGRLFQLNESLVFPSNVICESIYYNFMLAGQPVTYPLTFHWTIHVKIEKHAQGVLVPEPQNQNQIPAGVAGQQDHDDHEDEDMEEDAEEPELARAPGLELEDVTDEDEDPSYDLAPPEFDDITDAEEEEPGQYEPPPHAIENISDEDEWERDE